jgi:ribonuclease HI
MACVTTVKYSVKFNGTLLEAFSPTRGLRQGDPLSPFLFLFVADGLSTLLSNEVNQNRITPIKVCRRAPGISHLLFADDALLFFRATEEQAICVKNTLEVYASCTGQLINPAKCSITFSTSCPQAAQGRIRSILHVEQQGFEAKYLGLPTPEGRMHRGKFDNLQARLSRRLMDSGDNLMSQSAKEVLIKSVAQAIPTYIMSVFKLPALLCDDLTKLIRDYWWGVEQGKRKTNWVSWAKLNRSKSQGGLGFRDMRLFNQALLARQAWRLLAFPDSLCARVLKARYYPNGQLFDTVFTGNPSSTWTAISYGLELLKQGLIWRIGNGRSVRIWRDNWIPRTSCCKVLTPKGNKRIKRVSELIDANGHWKTILVRNSFYPIESELILAIKPSRHLSEDVLAWQPENSGVFSVRSAYRLALSAQPVQCDMAATSSIPDGQHPCWTRIWQSTVPPKVKMFAWKAASGALATERNKLRRNIRVTGRCRICDSEYEDEAHALFICPHARRLWEEMRKIWSLPTDQDLVISPSIWFHEVLLKIPVHMVDTTMLVAWRAWYARNEATHDKPLPSIESSKGFLLSYLKLIREIKDKPTLDIIKGKSIVVEAGPILKPPSVKKGPNKPWSKPPTGWIKLSIDGSFRMEDRMAGLGMVLRDEEGLPIFSACQFLEDCQSPMEAELRACLEGIELTRQHSQLPLIIETDCSQLVVAVSSPTHDRSPFLHWVNEIKSLASILCQCRFVKVERIQVRVSDFLANLARLQHQSMIWLGSGPEDVLQLLELDRSVTPPV